MAACCGAFDPYQGQVFILLLKPQLSACCAAHAEYAERSGHYTHAAEICEKTVVDRLKKDILIDGHRYICYIPASLDYANT